MCVAAAVFVGDVADPVQAQSAIAYAVERFGGLDVVVANAGGHGFATIAETTDSDWSDACRANLDTAFVLLRAAMPELVRRKGKGSIAVTASIASLAAPASAFGYTVTKHA